MTGFKVEYLITVDQKDVFCNSVASFNNLLRSLDGLAISGDSIEFGSLKVGYEIQTGEISSDKQRFFHLKLSCPLEKQLDDFDNLLRSIRVVLSKASGKPVQILWDGVSFFYAQKAYPLIYEIENIMRKLITKFMLINIGLGWTSEAIPQEVVESIRGKSQKSSQNYLYEVDFIQLSNFLFKEYPVVNTSALLDKIRKANSISDLDLSELKESIPQSNWERYFSSLVDCESDYLRAKWEKLYERRNQVAHNKAISKTEFDEILTLIDELMPKLQKAIDSLDNINISEEEREVVAENVAGSKSVEYGEFLNIWGHLQHMLLELALAGTNEESERRKIFQLRNNLRGLLNILTKDQRLVSRELRSEILELSSFRNVLVHQPDAIFTEDSIQNRIENAQECVEKLMDIIRGIQATKENLSESEANDLNNSSEETLKA